MLSKASPKDGPSPTSYSNASNAGEESAQLAHSLPPHGVAVGTRSRRVDRRVQNSEFIRAEVNRKAHSSGSGAQACLVTELPSQAAGPKQCRRPSHIAAAFGAGLRGSRRHARRASNLALQSQFTFRQGTIKGVVRQDSASSSKRDTKGSPKSFLETVVVDEKRKILLQEARQAGPNSAFRCSYFKNTVVPRVVQCPLTWLTFAAFITSATLVRSGWWDTTNVSLDDFESQGMTTLVTFLVVFYVGYCNDRHYQQCE